MSKIIMRDNDRVMIFLRSIEQMMDNIENLSENYRTPLNGEFYLTDSELSKRLKIERRTLQEYRTNEKIPYYKLGGKILYAEGDIQKLLEQNYNRVFEKCW